MGRNAKRNGNHGNGHSRTHSDVALASPLSARDHFRRRDGGCSLRGCASPSRCCCRHEHGNPNYTLAAGQVVKTDLIVAADREHGNPNYTLAAGQVVKTDLIVGADRAVIDGDVDGDSDLLVAQLDRERPCQWRHPRRGELITVNGTVDGNVRAFCQTLQITGSVGKNLMAWSGNVTLDRRGKVGGTGTIGAGDIDLDGHIGRDLLALFKTLDLNGSIGGNVRTQGRSLTIGSGAEITGTTKFKGPNPPDVAPGAKLGPLEFKRHERGPDRTSPRYYWHQVLLWGAGFVFGLVLLLVAPGFFYDVTNACKKVASASRSSVSCA